MRFQPKAQNKYNAVKLPFLACSIRNQTLRIHLIRTIESKGCKHWLIVEAIEVHRFPLIGAMLVLVPRRNAEYISGLPCKGLIANLGSSASCNNMINSGGSLATGRGRGGSVQPLCAATKNTTHFYIISLMSTLSIAYREGKEGDYGTFTSVCF